MREVLVILGASVSDSEREAVLRAAPAAQLISDRVFASSAADTAIPGLRAMPGIAAVLTGGEAVQSLPQLSDTERLFAEAWLARTGQTKQRRGEGLDWDTPPMVPPDPPPKR